MTKVLEKIMRRRIREATRKKGIRKICLKMLCISVSIVGLFRIACEYFQNWLKGLQWGLEGLEEKCQKGMYPLKSRTGIYDSNDLGYVALELGLAHPFRTEHPYYENILKVWDFLSQECEKGKPIFYAAVHCEQGDSRCGARFYLPLEAKPTAQDFLVTSRSGWSGQYWIYRVIEDPSDKILAEFKNFLKELEVFLTKDYLITDIVNWFKPDNERTALRFHNHIVV